MTLGGNIGIGLTFLAAPILMSVPNKATDAQDRWVKADAAVVRLSPSVFKELPRPVVRKLVSLGCTIPQVKWLPDKHNVIKGNFKRPGRTDWAVLCSRKRESSILVFWGGSADSFSQLANAGDRGYLQTIDGDGTIGFSRKISPIDKVAIELFARELQGPKPPATSHQGIDDAFMDKASRIHYYFRRRWLQLQGMD